MIVLSSWPASHPPRTHKCPASSQALPAVHCSSGAKPVVVMVMLHACHVAVAPCRCLQFKAWVCKPCGAVAAAGRRQSSAVSAVLQPVAHTHNITPASSGLWETAAHNAEWPTQCSCKLTSMGGSLGDCTPGGTGRRVNARGFAHHCALAQNTCGHSEVKLAMGCAMHGRFPSGSEAPWMVPSARWMPVFSHALR